MSLLDDVPPRFTPKYRGGYISSYDKMTEEKRLEALNNLGRDIEPDDYSESIHLDT